MKRHEMTEYQELDAYITDNLKLDHQKIKTLLENLSASKEPLNEEMKESLLYKASLYDSPQIMNFLAQKGVNLNVAIGNSKFTPLHFAAGNNYPTSVRVLLDHGADPTIVDAQGRTASQLAIQNGCQEISRFIESRIRSPQTSPIHKVSFAQQDDIQEFFKHQPASYVNKIKDDAKGLGAVSPVAMIRESRSSPNSIVGSPDNTEFLAQVKSAIPKLPLIPLKTEITSRKEKKPSNIVHLPDIHNPRTR